MVQLVVVVWLSVYGPIRKRFVPKVARSEGRSWYNRLWPWEVSVPLMYRVRLSNLFDSPDGTADLDNAVNMGLTLTVRADEWDGRQPGLTYRGR